MNGTLKWYRHKQDGPSHIAYSPDGVLNYKVASIAGRDNEAEKIMIQAAKRYNQHDELVTRLNDALSLLRNCLSYIPASGDDDIDLREAIEDALKK